MAKRSQHVVPFCAGWAVASAGAKKATAFASRKADAITIATHIAKENYTDVVIYGRDGKVKQRKSFKRAF